MAELLKDEPGCPDQSDRAGSEMSRVPSDTGEFSVVALDGSCEPSGSGSPWEEARMVKASEPAESEDLGRGGSWPQVRLLEAFCM